MVSYVIADSSNKMVWVKGATRDAYTLTNQMLGAKEYKTIVGAQNALNRIAIINSIGARSLIVVERHTH